MDEMGYSDKERWEMAGKAESPDISAWIRAWRFGRWARPSDLGSIVL